MLSNNKNINTVALTGATGFIGRGLVSYFLQKGIRVKALLRDNKHNNTDYLNQDGVSIELVGDLATNKINREQLYGVDSLVHLASLAHINYKKLGSKSDIISNAKKISENIAIAANNSAIKNCVFLSSIKVFGEKTIDSPFSEKSSLNPVDAYGIAKLESENIIKSIYPQVIILRPPLVYGPHVKANFKLLLKIVHSGLPLPIQSINNKRSFIYIYNLADSILSVMNASESIGKTFIVSDLGSFSSPELISIISRYMGKTTKIFKVNQNILNFLSIILGQKESLDKFTNTLEVNSNYIEKEIGWVPKYSFNQGIENTCKWFINSKKK